MRIETELSQAGYRCRRKKLLTISGRHFNYY